MPGSPAYSIVIVCFGKRAVTERCLASLDRYYGGRLGGDVELVLVDNGSPDDTPELLSSYSDRAHVILLKRNLNYAGGNNVGAHAARGDVVILLNNDTELLDCGSLDALAEQTLEPGVGIAGLRLLYPDGTIQHAGCAWRRDPDGRVLPFHLFQFESGDHPMAGAIYEGDVVTGACLAIRRALLLELGGLDETFVNGLEDVDLCVRVRLAGHRVVYRGDLALLHAEGATRSQSPNDARNQELFVSRYRTLTHDDQARFTEQFDAHERRYLVALYPGVTPTGAAVSLEGEISGLSEQSAEARALLAGLEAAGLAPAMREWQPLHLVPSIDAADAALLDRTQLRPRQRDALIVQCPVGRLGAVEPHGRAILRLGGPLDVDLSGVGAVWATSSAAADELIAAGCDADRIEILLPPVPDVACGAGGEGLLLVLPGHDLARCAELLRAAAPLTASVRTRLLPTIATEPLAALAAGLAPGAHMLAPISCELRFGALAGECDAVVCADPKDRFERRALIAGAAGTAVVTAGTGPAAGVFGDGFVFTGSGDALRDALAASADRRKRRSAVIDVCGREASRRAIAALVARADERSRPRRRLSCPVAA